MPIPDQRDLGITRDVLAGWLAEHISGARDVAVSEISVPSGTGYSNETLILDATWSADGEPHRDGLVVRIKPTGYQLFLESDFELQYRVLETLQGAADVAVPPVLWFEDDADVLGAPFFVMRHIEGRAAADSPSYNAEGWLADATPAEREKVWRNGLDALVRVHRVPTGLVTFLSKSALGDSGFDQQLRYWERSFEWACHGMAHPVAESTWEWLTANLPSDRPTGLSWGDARIGNILFHEGEVRAVLDWEMVSLGGHLEDLGWWLFLDRYHDSEAPRLPGLGSRADTISLWEDGTGEKATDLEWYEVFGGFRFAVVMMRLAQMFESWGVARDAMGDMEIDNPVTRLLATTLELPPPVPRTA